MIKKKIMGIEYVENENENERKRLLKIYNRRNIIVCFAFFVFCLLLPDTKENLPPILLILVNNPKQGLAYASIILAVDLLLYIWLRIDTYKSVQHKNEKLKSE